jgi:ferredoxin
VPAVAGIARINVRKCDAPADGAWLEENAMPGKLKIRVDKDKCQGHARCKSLAPELFELDEFGSAHEIGDGSVPAGLEDKAWLAQTNCPEIAIEVTEK